MIDLLVKVKVKVTKSGKAQNTMVEVLTDLEPPASLRYDRRLLLDGIHTDPLRMLIIMQTLPIAPCRPTISRNARAKFAQNSRPSTIAFFDTARGFHHQGIPCRHLAVSI